MRKLLGRILVEGGFASQTDVAHALAMQSSQNKQLGEILIGMGVIDRQQLQVVLRIQDDLSDPERALKLAAGIRLKLGEMMVDAGLASRHQLDEALKEQAGSGEKLGEIALRRGWLEPVQLERALRFQKAQAGVVPGHTPLRLGELLVSTGDITQSQLDAALESQRETERPLGRLLVDAGYLKPHRLAEGLHLQRMLVLAALSTILTVGTMVGSAPAEAAGNQAQVAVSATVLRHASVRALTMPHTVSIAAADIARGYVDVPISSKLEIRSNSPGGYMLAFESQADFARGIEVRGVGAAASFGRFGGVLSVQAGGRGMQTTPVELSFRVLLSEEASPGVHPWPVQISVLPF